MIGFKIILIMYTYFYKISPYAAMLDESENSNSSWNFKVEFWSAVGLLPICPFPPYFKISPISLQSFVRKK